MQAPLKILNPSGYITQQALALATSSGGAVAVSGDNPLPVTISTTWAAPPAPMSGTTSVSILTKGFAPIAGRPIWLMLDGNWAGTVTVRRSAVAGAAPAPLTIGGKPWAVFDRNAMEPIGEESVAGATWHLDIALTSGTLIWEVRQ